ncbi:MAG: sulfite exporter TauE/SafE family protein, partial [Pseudomonadota bacterium]|nr:sulfite exporter TauE/SafE family protein [Pseudomonadota bacterium]
LLWRSLEWRGLTAYALGVGVTVALVQWVAWVPSRGILLLLLGATPFLALAIPERLALRFERPKHGFSAGLLVTAGQLFAGASGPLLDSFFLRGSRGREATVATKGFAQCLGHGAKLGVYGPLLAQGAELTVLSWPLLLALGPAAILGTASGTALLTRWNDEAFLHWSRMLVRGLGLVAMGSGAFLLLTA